VYIQTVPLLDQSKLEFTYHFEGLQVVAANLTADVA
jgi:hypothetical protein